MAITTDATTTTTNTEEIGATAAQDMVTAADGQIAELEAMNHELDARIQSACAELAEIAEGRTRSARALTQARAEVQRLEAEYNQADSYARLAHKTPNEGRAIKAASEAKKALQAARRELDRLAHDDADAEQVARVREQEVQKQLHLLAFEKDTHLSELTAIQCGREQAMHELGQEKLQAFTAGYCALQKQIDALSAQLVAAQIELHDLHETAQVELADWPEAQRTVAKLAPQEDAIERLLQAARMYLEVIQEEACRLPSALPIGPGGFGFWDIVVIPGELIGKSIRYPELIDHRLRQIDVMLADWKKRGKRGTNE